MIVYFDKIIEEYIGIAIKVTLKRRVHSNEPIIRYDILIVNDDRKEILNIIQLYNNGNVNTIYDVAILYKIINTRTKEDLFFKGIDKVISLFYYLIGINSKYAINYSGIINKIKEDIERHKEELNKLRDNLKYINYNRRNSWEEVGEYIRYNLPASYTGQYITYTTTSDTNLYRQTGNSYTPWRIIYD